MKKILPLVLFALVLGYLLGTESGRAQRDQLLARLRRDDPGPESDAGATDPIVDLSADAATASAVASQ